MHWLRFFAMRMIVLAGTASLCLALSACGGDSSSTSTQPTPAAPATPAAPPALTVADGCSTPAGYTFTDARAHVEVTDGVHKGETYDLAGVDPNGFETFRPNNNYTKDGDDGSPFLSVTIGKADSKGLVIEIEGTDPCKSADSTTGASSGGYVALLYGSEDTARFGSDAACDVKLDAFNQTGVRGTWTCDKVDQFGLQDNPLNLTAHGTFSAIGHASSGTTATPSASASS